MYYPLFCGTYFVNSVSGIRNDIKEKGEGRGRGEEGKEGEIEGRREGEEEGGKREGILLTIIPNYVLTEMLTLLFNICI